MSRACAIAVAGAAVLSFGSAIAGCGSGDSDTTQAGSPTAEATSTTRPASIVGRWEVLRTCEGMVKAADEAGLRRLTPSLVGDYFPDESAKQLARKAEICSGAGPQQHSHFFTEDGQFGSLDQHGEQVDDAPYRVVDDRTVRLSPEFGEEIYRYRITGGDRLVLEPVIPPRAKREALASPMEFSRAGHMAAVAYAGHTWKRVDCEGWC